MGARKEEALDNVPGIGILFVSPDSALIPYSFFPHNGKLP